jgi:hypothetical protein
MTDDIKRFEKIMDNTYQSLIKATEAYNTFWELREPDNKMDIRRAYVTFFWLTMIALKGYFSLNICNATQFGKKTGSMPTMLKFISSSKTLSEIYTREVIDGAWQILVKHCETLLKIKKYRDKSVAHSELGKEDLSIKFVCDRKDAEYLLKDITGKFNELSVIYNGTAKSFEISPTAKMNTRYILNDLAKYRQMRIKCNTSTI